MKKTIFLILILLTLIGAVGYYGYTTVLYPKSVSEIEADSLLADFDTDSQEISNSELSDETVLEIEQLSVANTSVAIVPATTADIDSIIAELNTFSSSDTSVYNTSLSDL